MDAENNAPDATWPAMTLAEANAMMTARGSPFELVPAEVDGREVLSWKHQPATLRHLARKVRSEYAEREFVIHEDERLTFGDWFKAMAKLSHELVASGVKPGDRVAIAMRNMPEWPVAFFAIGCAGAIAVPLNAWWSGAELAYGLQDSGARILVCDPERWDAIAPHMQDLPQIEQVLVARSKASLPDPARALEDVLGPVGRYGVLPEADLPDIAIAPDDDLTIFYTSGTTGKPKGALGTHRNLLTCTLAASYCIARSALRRGEPLVMPGAKSGLLVIPLFHVTACASSMMNVMMTGASLVLMRKWDTKEAFALIEKERIQSTGGVPTIAWQLLEHPARKEFDLSSLEMVTYGGAPAAGELVRRIDADLQSAPGMGWGMTETSATVTFHMAEDYRNRPESCGPPLPVARLRIMDADGKAELSPGEIGELWAYGPQVVRGYWNKPEATAETFVDGWVRTGDMAVLDDEGFCTIVDRAKDIVIRGGENIYSLEVESCLYDHPAVVDAAVVGIPHRTLGEEPAAMVMLAPGTNHAEGELQDWVRARLAGFKVPVRVVTRPDPLPRNANGKIQKPIVREQILAACEGRD